MGKRQESNRSCAKKYSLREGEGLIGPRGPWNYGECIGQGVYLQ